MSLMKSGLSIIVRLLMKPQVIVVGTVEKEVTFFTGGETQRRIKQGLLLISSSLGSMVSAGLRQDVLEREIS